MKTAFQLCSRLCSRGGSAGSGSASCPRRRAGHWVRIAILVFRRNRQSSCGGGGRRVVPLYDADDRYRCLRNKRPRLLSVARHQKAPPSPRISRLTGQQRPSRKNGRLFCNASHSLSGWSLSNIEIRGTGASSPHSCPRAFISQTADSFSVWMFARVRAWR